MLENVCTLIKNTLLLKKNAHYLSLHEAIIFLQVEGFTSVCVAAD